MPKRIPLGLAALLLPALVVVIGSTGAVAAPPPGIVISQVYGGGGNSQASHTHDFVELYNPGDAPVPLEGLSLQYASATGTGALGNNAGQLTELSGTIQPHRYFLVREVSSGAGGATLPTPDHTADTTPINLSGTAGKVALATGVTTLGCNGGSTACNADQRARILDLVGYGGANFYEGPGPAPLLTNDRSAQRENGGCVDTDDNAADFDAAPTAPRNSSDLHFCDADAAPEVASHAPGADEADVAVDASVTVTFGEDVAPAGDWFAISCTASGPHPATASGGPRTFTLDPAADFALDEECTVTVTGANVTDTDENDPPDAMAANYSWSFTTPALTLRIRQIQGAGHLSSYAGRRTSHVPGVVTAVRTNGFWMQDPSTDANAATSEGIFVFTSSAPTVAVGEAVTVSGRVTEFRPGGEETDNLTVTELERATVYPAGPGAPVAPTVVGAGGRMPPGAVIEDDAFASFDAADDGIDFYESLEGMLLQVDDAAVVGPTNGFGEVWVVGDGGAHAALRTARGGLVVRPGDFNPERIQLDDVLAETPDVHVGDRIPGATVGVLSYDFGNFELLPRTAPVAVSGGLQRETTAATPDGQLAVATFNVENLDPSDGAAINRLARIVVDNLRSPDLIGIEEMQDNSGATDDGTTAANESWESLIEAITEEGGPAYDYRQIDPVDGADGGQPGGNIRVGFLFRTDRGLAFVDRPGGDAGTPTGVSRSRGRVHLTLSPGRVDPQNPAWVATRKPLAGEFTWQGETLIAIVNHFSSKGGDDPLFGRVQPPVRSTEVARHRQAASVNAFVGDILDLKPNAHVVVLGDINDFEFSETTAILEGDELFSLPRLLSPGERYSYVFEGNSQVLDQILVSAKTREALTGFDIVHVNAEFADQASDHDPSVVRLAIAPRE